MIIDGLEVIFRQQKPHDVTVSGPCKQNIDEMRGRWVVHLRYEKRVVLAIVKIPAKSNFLDAQERFRQHIHIWRRHGHKSQVFASTHDLISTHNSRVESFLTRVNSLQES